MKNKMLEQDWIYMVCKPSNPNESPTRDEWCMDKYNWTIIIWKEYSVWRDICREGNIYYYIKINVRYFNTKRLKLIWYKHNVDS